MQMNNHKITMSRSFNAQKADINLRYQNNAQENTTELKNLLRHNSENASVSSSDDIVIYEDRSKQIREGYDKKLLTNQLKDLPDLTKFQIWRDLILMCF